MHSQWGRRELNPHLHDDQRYASVPEVRHAASYTTAPMFSRGYAFQACLSKHVHFYFVSLS